MTPGPSRKPDYYVSAIVKGTEKKGRIGAAWKKDDGSISVRLNVFVTLEQNPDLVITMFPNNDEAYGKGKQQQQEEDVPF